MPANPNQTPKRMKLVHIADTHLGLSVFPNSFTPRAKPFLSNPYEYAGIQDSLVNVSRVKMAGNNDKNECP